MAMFYGLALFLVVKSDRTAVAIDRISIVTYPLFSPLLHIAGVFSEAHPGLFPESVVAPWQTAT